MNILISTKYSLDQPIGSSVIAIRHAKMFKEKGHNVMICCPNAFSGEELIENIRVLYYTYDNVPIFLFNRSNSLGLNNLKLVISTIKPNILYDVHGPTWAIDEAFSQSIPIISMVGDYNHLCLLNFLVTPKLKRCDGPTNFMKCINCYKKSQPIKVLLASILFKNKLLNLVLKFVLGYLRAERWDFSSGAYIAFNRNKVIRAKVNYYIIGDKQAETIFFRFADPQKIIINQQFLPLDIQYKIKLKIKSNKNNMFIVGYIGRLDNDKGFSTLLKAFVELDDYSNIALWIVHKFDATPERIQTFGFKKNKIIFLIKNEKIRCFNPQNNEILFEIMSNFSIGIIPSIQYETPNLVLLELIAGQIPVIRSESDGMIHLIKNNINGFTYKYDNYVELYKTIEFVRNNPSILTELSKKLPSLKNENDYYSILKPYLENINNTITL